MSVSDFSAEKGFFFRVTESYIGVIEVCNTLNPANRFGYPSIISVKSLNAFISKRIRSDTCLGFNTR